jgi:protein TonB
MATTMADLIAFKKRKREDANKKGLLIFSMALMLAMGAVALVFHTKFLENPKPKAAPKDMAERFVPVIDIPITEQEPPLIPIQDLPLIIDPNQVVLDLSAAEIKEIENHVEAKVDGLNLDMELKEGAILVARGVYVDQSLIDAAKEQKESVEEIFEFVERQPEPEGGMEAFYAKLYSMITYPRNAALQGIEGRVYVAFVVETNGSMSNFELIKGIGGGCDEEALRVLAASNYQWQPGANRGRPVRVLFRMPIHFQIKK